ncbi:MAG: AAA family ATPase [Leptospirillia bacterium]
MEIVAVANQKGGCGKTTTAINLAASLGARGKRVLLVDMDPQGHASLGLGQRCEERPGLYEVFLREVTVREVIVENVAEGVDLVPGTISLAAVEHLLADTPEREWRLATYLDQVAEAYDYTVIDCPPSLGLLSFNALRAAQRVVVPVEMSTYSLDGVERLSETIDLLTEKYDTQIKVTLVPTMVDLRPRFAREMLRDLRGMFPDIVSQATIHATIRIKEAAHRGVPITVHDPENVVAFDYDRLAREVLGEAVGRVSVTAFREDDTSRIKEMVVGTSMPPGAYAIQDVAAAGSMEEDLDDGADEMSAETSDISEEAIDEMAEDGGEDAIEASAEAEVATEDNAEAEPDVAEDDANPIVYQSPLPPPESILSGFERVSLETLGIESGRPESRVEEVFDRNLDTDAGIDLLKVEAISEEELLKALGSDAEDDLAQRVNGTDQWEDEALLEAADEEDEAPLEAADEEDEVPLEAADEDDEALLEAADEDDEVPLEAADEDDEALLEAADEEDDVPLKAADEDDEVLLEAADEVPSGYATDALISAKLSKEQDMEDATASFNEAVKAAATVAGPAFIHRADLSAASAATEGEGETLSEVVLNFGRNIGKRVQVAGDFNGWIPDRGIDTRSEDGGMSKVMHLKPGDYQYRVIVDGIWQEDPENPNRVPNIYGGSNSLLIVNPSPEAPQE